MAKTKTKDSEKPDAPTPMMAQYAELKDQAGDCLLFYRMGDFFELFFDDAKAASATLDIALTSRGHAGGEPVPMCGVPVHSAETYLAKLIRAGHRVAIAEQTETPEQAKARAKAEGKPVSKALVARDIIRFVTAGTLTEDALLDSRRENVLVAVTEVRGRIGLAGCDISTGRFELLDTEVEQLSSELARFGASETIASEGLSGSDADSWIIRDAATFDSAKGERRIKELFEVATLDAFGDFTRAEFAAAAGLLAYLEHVGRGTMPLLSPPSRALSGEYLAIDRATRESLEIVASQRGGREGSLLHCIDRTVTGGGARQLMRDISAPLLDRTTIDDRLDLVGFFTESQLMREAVRGHLRQFPDVERALGRIVAGRGTPRDLGQLRDGLDHMRQLFERIAGEDARPPLLERLLPMLDGHDELTELLLHALVPSPPTEMAQGGFIADGFDEELDALRETSKNGRRAIAALEADYREKTGISSLKIKHNAVLGYFIEVPSRHGDTLMAEGSGFTHRQTMAGAVRFNSSELHEEAARIVEAGSRSIAAETAHFETLRNHVLARTSAITDAARAIARLDVASGLATRAIEGQWTRPNFVDEPVLAIEGGRHPVVESALRSQSERFVANDCELSEADRLWLVSGPNMGGKSTFLRQNALIVLLAQAGAFVPAETARLGIVDRLFSRVGASDNLARGQSTFMVEMVETAAILAQASENSFVILDEVGRGTSTYDGLALAWAVVEAIHERNRCRCLFATHYHELTLLAETLDSLSLHHVRAREWKGELVLLHEVDEGPADRSYGLAVAKLAGIPKQVLARAKSVLDRLEQGRAKSGGLAAGLAELPLFANAAQAEEKECDRLREELASIDVDALSPREALDTLYRLKDRLSEED